MQSQVQEKEPAFFAVSIRKLVVLSICSLGFYELYWFYRNWRYIKSHDRSTISPTIRGVVFALLFCYPCLARIRDFDRPQSNRRLPAGPLAAGWIGMVLLSLGQDQFALLSLLSCVFLIPAQLEVNRLNGMVAPHHDSNHRFALWDWFVIVPGGAVLLLLIVGLLVGAQHR